MSGRLTLATATGLPFLALAFHVATAAVALMAGFIAVAARKGGIWHRRSGLIFVCAMIASGIAVAGIYAYEGRSIAGGVVLVYFALTAYTAVRPLPRAGRQTDIALMVLAFTFAILGYNQAVVALGRPRHQIDGVPAGMMFFLNTIILLAALGDARLVRAGAFHGTRRLARHLWRMCFALFVASGSFFLGQMKFIPEPVRILPLLLVLGVSPLLMLLYWMWRVRLRHNLRGMITRNLIDTVPSVTPARTSS